MYYRDRLTARRLKEVLRYDPETGLFTWLRPPGKRGRSGPVACSVTSYGYIRIKIDGLEYMAHRLVWLYIHDRWPSHQIDHKNHVKSDNRLANLRECTPSQNRQYKGAMSNNALGFKGVTRDGKRYRAVIQHDGRQLYLGSFSTPQLAYQAYVQKERELFGEFAWESRNGQ